MFGRRRAIIAGSSGKKYREAAKITGKFCRVVILRAENLRENQP